MCWLLTLLKLVLLVWWLLLAHAPFWPPAWAPTLLCCISTAPVPTGSPCQAPAQFSREQQEVVVVGGGVECAKLTHSTHAVVAAQLNQQTRNSSFNCRTRTMIASSSAAALRVDFSFSLVRALSITSLQGLSVALSTILLSACVLLFACCCWCCAVSHATQPLQKHCLSLQDVDKAWIQ